MNQQYQEILKIAKEFLTTKTKEEVEALLGPDNGNGITVEEYFKAVQPKGLPLICTWTSEGEDWIPSCNPEIQFFKSDVDTLWGALPKGSDFHCPACTKKVETVGDPDMFARYNKKPNRFKLNDTGYLLIIVDTEADDDYSSGIASYDNQYDLDNAKRLLKLLNDYVPHRR